MISSARTAARRTDIARTAARVLAVAWLAATPLAHLACTEPRTCYEGDFAACTCADGRLGFAACDTANDAFAACGSCGLLPGAPTTWVYSGSEGGAGGTATTTALAAFMEDCTVNEDCESSLCFSYTAKGQKCTLPCTTDSDCPPPSTGCNNKGVCKAP
ncbi:MAG: hypothetical protein R3B70_21145 [Polyangiaceae bacterium]